MKNIYCIGASLILLCGCQAMMPKPIPPDLSGQCISNLANNPELMVIRTKVALGGLDTQTVEMLANSQKPNASEKVALLKWDSLRQPCIKMSQEWLSQYGEQNISVINDRVANEFKVLLADLYAGKITYGEFAKGRQVITGKANIDAQAAYQQNQAYADQQRQQSEQNRLQRQALRNQQDAINNQLLINATKPQNYQLPPPPIFGAPNISAPVQTNCVPNGMGGFRCQ